MGTLRARLPLGALVCSQFVGRSEHTVVFPVLTFGPLYQNTCMFSIYLYLRTFSSTKNVLMFSAIHYRLHSLSHSPTFIFITILNLKYFPRKMLLEWDSNPQPLCQCILPDALTTCATENGSPIVQISLHWCNSFVMCVFVTA